MAKEIKFFDKEHQSYILLVDKEGLVLKEWFGPRPLPPNGTGHITLDTYLKHEGPDTNQVFWLFSEILDMTASPPALEGHAQEIRGRRGVRLAWQDTNEGVLTIEGDPLGFVHRIQQNVPIQPLFSTFTYSNSGAVDVRVGDFIILGDPDATMFCWVIGGTTGPDFQLLVLSHKVEGGSVLQFPDRASFVPSETIPESYIYVDESLHEAYTYKDDTFYKITDTSIIVEAQKLITAAIKKIFVSPDTNPATYVRFIMPINKDGVPQLAFLYCALDKDTLEPTFETAAISLIGEGSVKIKANLLTMSYTFSSDATRGNTISADTKDDFPTKGELGFTYVAIDTKKMYVWEPDSETYLEISALETGDVMVISRTFAEKWSPDPDPEFLYLEETVKSINPITGVTYPDQVIAWVGNGTEIRYNDADKQININANVVHNTSLVGKGTVEDPLMINLSIGSGLIGFGTESQPLTLNAQHDETMTGTGTTAQPLSVSIEVDSNPMYSRHIYLGVDNQYIAPYIPYPAIDGHNAGSIVAGSIIDRFRTFRVVMHSAVTDTTTPYVFPGTDSQGHNPFINFIHPGEGAGSAHYELMPDKVVWQELNANGQIISETVFAENGFWIPNISTNGAYTFGSWNVDTGISPDEACGLFWPLDTKDPYPGTAGFPDTTSPGYGPYLLFEIYRYYSVKEHIEDYYIDESGQRVENLRHVTADERQYWNDKVDPQYFADTVDAINNNIDNVAQRAEAIGEYATQIVAAEASTRSTEDARLLGLINGLQSLGHYLTSVDTYNDTTGGKTSLLTLDITQFPDATHGDFVTIRDDETRAGSTTIYRLTDLNPVTWQFDYIVSTDTTNKIDKIDMTNPQHVVGQIPTVDSNGELTGPTIDPTSLATSAALQNHIGDGVKHITAEERADWNSRATSAALTAEVSRATQRENDLLALLTALQSKGGVFVGSYANQSLLPTSSTSIIVGDFAIVIADSSRDNATSFYRVSAKSGNALTWAFIVAMPMTEDVISVPIPLASARGTGTLLRWGHMRQLIIEGVGGTAFSSWAVIGNIQAFDAPFANSNMYIRGVTLNSAGNPSATPVPMFSIHPDGEIWLCGTGSLSSYNCSCVATWFTSS